jgi:predicted thioesterase
MLSRPELLDAGPGGQVGFLGELYNPRMTQGPPADATAKIPIGAWASKSVVVAREMTVAHFHDDMPEVYGTPMMIYLMEVAAAEAIAGYLPQGWGSVGAVVNVKHLAATPVGFTVTARAEVTSVSDRLVNFIVEAHDGVEKIGEGTHTRGIINLERFEARFRAKAGQSAGKR